MQSSVSWIAPIRDPEPEPPRPLPGNAEAEQALLGAIFRDNRAHGRVADFLQPEHFSYAVHARIYAAICKIIDRGQLANPITLGDFFKQDDALIEIGGAQYLVQLADAAVTIINAEH
jgi:replicative DNA helicase